MNQLNSLKSLLVLILIYVTNINYAQGNLTVEEKVIESKILVDNKIGINENRNVKIVLPPSYNLTKKDYPVVYYFHNTFDNYLQIFNDFKIDSILAKAYKNQRSKEFILVVADYSSPTIGSVYENSTTSGKWLDFTIEELVPFIDKNYRTIKKPASRAAVGFFFGGLGAMKLGMLHPDKIGIVYAMHPVGSGSGYLPRAALDVNWEAIHKAKSFEDLNGTGRTQVFAAICQAFLPNENRPPFYCDFLFEYDQNGKLVLNAKNVRKEQIAFHFDEALDQNIENLQSLRAFAFDWARFDPTQAHVISNRRLSKLLTEINVLHDGEEYAGNPWESYWKSDGRFYTRVLPYLNKHFLFKDN